MLLKELFDTKTSNKNTNKTFDVEGLRKTRDLLRLSPSKNMGAYGKVTQSRNDPFTINKTPHLPQEDIQDTDSYSIYIKKITDDKMAQKNPYFPRVYDIKITSDKYQQQKYSIKMEKLQNISQSSDEELIYFLEKMFKIELFPQRYQPLDELTHEGKIRAMSFALKESIDNDSLVNDEILEEALNYLKMLYNNPAYGLAWDLHAGNYMVRRTPSGGQIVFVDPFK